MEADSETCPCEDAHRRLMDLHEDIHRAVENYLDSNEFRRCLNAAIQNSRGVTFLLQKRKAQWADFDQWYLPWQDDARKNSVLAWGVAARNRIVKEEDLKTLSSAKISLYGDRALLLEQEFVVGPRITVDMLVWGFMRARKRKPVYNTGTVRVQRRWIDDQLPDYELVDALREMYRGVSAVVQSAHKASGVAACGIHPFSRECVTAEIEPELLCLPHGDTIPSKIFSLATGEVSTVEYLSIERDEARIEAGREKYGKPPVLSKDPITHALERLELSKKFLESDGYSGPSLLLFKGEEVQLHSLMFTDGEPREMKIAAAIETHGAWQFDGVVFSAEMWISSPEGRGSLVGVPASELLDSNDDLFTASAGGNRDEALSVIALTADGRSRWLVLPYGRTTAGIVYGELTDDDTGRHIPYFMRPIWQRWPAVGQRAWSGDDTSNPQQQV